MSAADPLRLRSGMWLLPQYRARTARTLVAGTLHAVPFQAPVGAIVLEIAVKITTEQPDSVLRFGLYDAAADGLPGDLVAELGAAPPLSFGFILDLHFGDIEPNVAGDLYFREADEKLAAAVTDFNKLDLGCVLQCGDFVEWVDADTPTVTANLVALEAVLGASAAPHRHVLGNHDGVALTRQQYAAATNMPAPPYAFDAGGYRCLVLDSSSATVSVEQLTWLAAGAPAASPVIVFCHYELHDSGTLPPPPTPRR